MRKYPSPKTPEFWLFLSIFFGAWIRSFYYICYKKDFIFFLSPIGESRTFLELSKDLIFLDVFKPEFLFASPVYTILIAFSRLFIGSFHDVFTIQILFGILNIYLVYLVTKHLFNKKTAAMAGWIFALTPIFPFYETKLNPLTLTITCILLMTYSFIKIVKENRFSHYGLFGIAYGLLCYLYGHYIFFLPFGLIVLLIFSLKFFFKYKSRFIFGLIVFLIITFPIILWHQMIAGKRIIVPRKIGTLFYSSNMLKSESNFFAERLSQSEFGALKRSVNMAENEKRSLIPMDEVGGFLAAKRAGLIIRNPLNFLGSISKKTVKLISLNENSHERSFAYESADCFSLYFLFIPGALIVILGLVSMTTVVLNRPIKLFYTILILLSLSAYFLLSSQSEYRALIVILLIPFSSHLLISLIDNFKSSKFNRNAAIFVFIIIAVMSTLFQKARIVESKPSVLYYNFGIAYENLKFYPSSLRWYKMAMNEKPGDLNLIKKASLAALKGSLFYEAKELLKTGLKINPRSTEINNNMGLACLNLGQLKEAEKRFLKVLKTDKYHPYALFNLGTVYRRSENNEKALEFFLMIRRGTRPFYKSRESIAQIYASIEEYQKALDYYAILSKKFPKNPYYKFKSDEIHKLIKKKEAVK